MPEVLVVIALAAFVLASMVLRREEAASHNGTAQKDTFSGVDGGKCGRGHCDPPS